MAGLALPKGWEWRTLGGGMGLSTINPRRPSLTRDNETPTSFLPMQGVDEVEGVIAQLEVRPYHKVRAGYTYFEENDVLFAKITPSMQNGKSAIARGLIDGFGLGSTEFHVLRPKPGILPQWLHLFVRQSSLRQEAMRHFRGAVGQQRVPQEFLESHPIPLPHPDDPASSLEAQRRIVARIETLFAELRAARDIHRKVVEDTGRLMEAVLGEEFPDPNRDLPGTWLVKPIEDISRPPQYGYTQSARSEPVGPRFLRISDIQNGQVDWSSVPYCESNQADLEKYRLKDGDIVFARSGATTGKTFLVKDPPEAVFASYLIRLQIERDTTPDFVYWFFQSPYYWTQIVPRGGAQPNMNAQILKKVKVPIVQSFATQARIVARLNDIREQVAEMQSVHADDVKLLSDVEQAILAQAFRGEL